MSPPKITHFIHRRKFLKMMGCALTSSALFTLSKDPKAQTAKSRIAVSNGIGKDAVKAALDALGSVTHFVQPGSVVLLKPNIAFPNPPEWGTTTSPWMVEAVSRLCLEAGAKRIVIVDNPVGGNPMKNIDRSGIGLSVAEIPQVKIMMLAEKTKFTPVEKDLYQLKMVEIARILLKADVLINLPTAKAHDETGVSFGMKNLMGLIWDRKVFHQTYNLDYAIAELSSYIKPDLIIMDASRVLINNGPSGPGEVREIGKIIAGTDPVAVDAYTLTLAEFNFRRMKPEHIPHIQYAQAINLGTAKSEDWEIVEV